MGELYPGWQRSLPQKSNFDPKAWLAKNPQARAFSMPSMIIAEHNKVLRDMRQNPAAMENHWTKNRYAGFNQEIGTLSPENRKQVMEYLFQNATGQFRSKEGKTLAPGVSRNDVKAYEQHFSKLQDFSRAHDQKDKTARNIIGAGAMGAAALATGGTGIPMLSAGLARGALMQGGAGILGMSQTGDNVKNDAERGFWQDILEGGGSGSAQYGAYGSAFEMGIGGIKQLKNVPGPVGTIAGIAGKGWNAAKMDAVLSAGFAGYSTYQFGDQTQQLYQDIEKQKKAVESGDDLNISDRARSVGSTGAFAGQSIYDAIPSVKNAFKKPAFGTMSKGNPSILDEFPAIGPDAPPTSISPDSPLTHRLFSSTPRKKQEPPPPVKPEIPKTPSAPPKEPPVNIKDPKYDKYFSNNSAQDVQKFAERLMRGESMSSLDDLQFQANNAEAIENALRNLNPELFPKNPPEKPPRKGSRSTNTNPRALNKNPRATRENPRATGENPRNQKPPEAPKVDPEKAKNQGELFPDGKGNTTYLPMAPWAMGAQLAMGFRGPAPAVAPKPPISVKPSTGTGSGATVPPSTGMAPSGSSGASRRGLGLENLPEYDPLQDVPDLPEGLEISPPIEDAPKFEPGKGLEFKPLPLPEVQPSPSPLPKPPGAPGVLPEVDLSPTPQPEEERVPIPKPETKAQRKTEQPPNIGGGTNQGPPLEAETPKDSDELMRKLLPFLSLLGEGGDAPSFPSVAHGIPAQAAPSFEKTHIDVSYFTDLGL